MGVGLPGFEPESIEPKSTSLDQASRQPLLQSLDTLRHSKDNFTCIIKTLTKLQHLSKVNQKAIWNRLRARDYQGSDSNHDGIGDASYVIDSGNIDHYPLMNMWRMWDVNCDGHINVLDLVKVANSLRSHPWSLNWNQNQTLKKITESMFLI
jgi:hypothetical protein